MLNTPILFIVFNRPETTSKVFKEIKSAKPSQLFIAADGPRKGKVGESERCDEVRNIVTQVDWDCKVYTLFRDKNLGCGEAVSTAIDWFFTHVERGIILEDDTLPNSRFFSFCEEMLEYYKDNEHIAQINGANFQLGKKWGSATYYYSNYPMIWGWATWRRSWRDYEYRMETYAQEKERNSFWENLDEKQKVYWKEIFEKMYQGFFYGKVEIDTWDYQWIYSCWKHKRISITPNMNLITNIGFGEIATHTKHESKVSYLPTKHFAHVSHPSDIHVSRKADKRLFKIYFNPPTTFLNHIRNVFYKIFPSNLLRRLRRFRRTVFPNLK